MLPSITWERGPVRRGLPNLRGSGAVTAAEGAVEIRQVAEACFIGHRADAEVGIAGIDQHAMGARQSASEHEIGESGAVFGEQLANIAFRNLQAAREVSDRQMVRMIGPGDLIGAVRAEYQERQVDAVPMEEVDQRK